MVVPVDEITSLLSVQIGVTIASVHVGQQLFFGFCPMSKNDCNIRERGDHEDAKHRANGSGTTQY